MNDPDACRASFAQCHCVLAGGHDGPHECVPDPICGGSWLQHPDDDPGMIRVYRWPGNRPGCDAYDLIKDRPSDPDPYILEPEDPMVTWARAKEQQLLDMMRSEP